MASPSRRSICIRRTPAVHLQGAQRLDADGSHAIIIEGRVGQQRPPAALQHERQVSVVEDDEGAAGAAGRAIVALTSTGPRERGAVGIGGVGCCQ